MGHTLIKYKTVYLWEVEDTGIYTENQYSSDMMRQFHDKTHILFPARVIIWGDNMIVYHNGKVIGSYHNGKYQSILYADYKWMIELQKMVLPERGVKRSDNK